MKTLAARLPEQAPLALLLLLLAALPTAAALLVSPLAGIALAAGLLALPLALASPALTLAGITVLTLVPGTGTSLPVKGLACLLLAALAVRSWREGSPVLERDRLLLPLGVLLFVRLVGLLFTPDFERGTLELLSLASLVLLFWMAKSAASRPSGLRLFTASLLGGGGLLVALALANAGSSLLGGSSAAGGVARLAFLYRNPNSLGQALLLVVSVALGLILFRGGRRLAAWAVVLGGLPVLLLTFSRGAWVGLLLAAAVLAARRYRSRAVPIALAALLLGGLAWTAFGSAFPVEPHHLRLDSGDGHRILTTVHGWEIFLEHPLLGVGTGGFAAAALSTSPPSLGPILRDPHNIPLGLLVENGIPGIAAFLLLLVAALRVPRELPEVGLERALAEGAVAGIAGIFLNGLFHGGLYFNPLWLVLALPGAACLAWNRRCEESAS